MFLISSLSSRAYGFVLNLVAILLAPLGWAVMHIVTEGLMGWAEANQVYTVVNGEVVVGAQTVFFVLLISVWIVIGTIGAPWLIWKLLNSGANVGASLLSSVGMSVGQGIAGGASLVQVVGCSLAPPVVLRCSCQPWWVLVRDLQCPPLRAESL